MGLLRRTLSFGEEIGYEFDGRLRIFFHNPMPGVGDYDACDTTGDETQIVRLRCAGGSLRSDRQDRHRVVWSAAGQIAML
jgi:hypothetical protein